MLSINLFRLSCENQTNQGWIVYKFLITISLHFRSIPSHASYEFEPSKYKCQGIEKRIDIIKSKMRAGYTNQEGERLKRELRQLKKQRSSCKDKGLSVQ